MKILMILLIACTLISCDSDDPLTQADCERLTDIETCNEKKCHWGRGDVIYAKCGEDCHFDQNTERFSGCFLSDTLIEEQVGMSYHRLVGDQYQIIDLNSNIGNLTGWVRGTPACVTCTWEWDNWEN